MLKLGIETQYKFKSGTTEKQGVSFKIGEDRFKGSKVDRKFSLGNLERTFVLQQRQSSLPRHENQKSYSDQNLHSRQTGLPGIKPGDYQDLKHDQPGKSLLEVLMKPEQSGNQLAGELSQDLTRKKKKKRSRRLGH